MKNLTLNRVPESTNQSLRAWSAADELLIDFLEEKNPESVTVYNDSFGPHPSKDSIFGVILMIRISLC